MDHERFWSRVQGELDSRRDPLADAVIVAWLEDHPEELEAFAAMHANLRAAATPVRHRSRWVATAIAIVLVGAVAAFWPRPKTVAPLLLPEIASDCRVLAFECVIESREGGHRREIRRTDESTETTQITDHSVSTSLRAPVLASIVSKRSTKQ